MSNTYINISILFIVCHSLDNILYDNMLSIPLLIFKCIIGVVSFNTCIILGNCQRSILLNTFLLINCWYSYHEFIKLTEILNLLFLIIWWFLYIRFMMTPIDVYINNRYAMAF